MALKGMRVKAKDNMRYGSTRVEFDSAKNRCRIVSQSLLEYIEFMRLEYDPEVIGYTPHPGIVVVMDATGNNYRSIFDAEIHLITGEIIYEEIKYASELIEGTNSEKDPFRSVRQINIQKEWCKQNGYRYKLMTDEELLDGKPALLSNMIFITQRLRPERIEDMSEVMAKATSVYMRLLDRNGRGAISALMEDDELDSVMTAVCYLLKEGKIEADLDTRALCSGSEVRIRV